MGNEVFAADEVNVTGAKLSEFGLYQRQNGKFNKWPWKSFNVGGGDDLIRSTDVIEATIDTTFGITYTIEGSPAKAEVDYVVEITHPETVDSKTGKTSTLSTLSSRRPIGVLSYNDVNLDDPRDLIAGEWKFRVLYNSKVLLEKSFTVNPAQQVSEANAQRIDDVPVFGSVSAVSAEDIHQAIDEATDKTHPDAPKKPRALTSLSAKWDSSL